MSRSMGRSGALNIVLVLVLVGLIVGMGVMGSFQVSGARSILERIYARRLMHVAVESALEEVAARLEVHPCAQGIPPPTAKRELFGDVLRAKGFPATVAPLLARKEFESQGVQIGDVTLRSSPWYCEFTPEAAGSVVIQELGVLEMKVAVKAQVGSSRISTTFTARRYMDATPDLGSSVPRLLVGPFNIALKID